MNANPAHRMNRRLRGTAALTVTVAVLACTLTPVAGMARDTESGISLIVDPASSAADSGANVPSGGLAALDVFSTIQDAVDAASSGDTINIAPGSYVEQVVIDGKDLTLVGSGRDSTFIVSPAALADSFVAGGFTNKPIVLCRNAANIRIHELTVDGDGQGNANDRFMGIAFFDAGGGIFDANILRVRNTPLDNVQHGFGVYSQTSGGGPYVVEFGNVDISDFQKSGYILNGTGLTADVHGGTITGSGDLSVIAQNGIQLSAGAGGSIRDCKISDLRYVPGVAVSAGVLVFEPGSQVSISGLTGPNAFTNVQAPIGWYNGSGSIDGVELSGPIIPDQDFSMILIRNFSTLGAPVHPAGSNRNTPYAEPVVETRSGLASGLGASQTSGPHAVDLSHLCLQGADIVGTVGVYAFSDGNPLVVNVTQSLLHDWDYGLRAQGAATELNVSNSSIVSNVSAGFDNSASGNLCFAQSNWWGAASGPSGDGPGSGDAILGPGVSFTPWLVSGVNSEPGCGFSASPELISATATEGCISLATPCVSIEVTIDRSTMVGMRGFSIPIQLSPNLKLCAGVSSITEGDYLSTVGASYLQVIDHGSGAYTVDGVLLGLPCGATAMSGTLFQVAVAKASGPDTAGTVTLGAPVLRDCDNATLAATAGAPVLLNIDTAAPAPIADMAAVQVTSTNDVDGTTKILLTFTAPPDADSVEVYRAGFGNYPEYDDSPGGGGAPSPPVYPPSAPWTLTTITTSGQADEVAERDFYYYVAFSRDTCGNYSPVSNRTGGTLNYHLGDVSNGVQAGQGNNQVLAEDVSLLGSYYLALLGPGDPLAYLDVGPTLNGSVSDLPATDDRIDFEDLIIFALNYSLVSSPLGSTPTDLAAYTSLSLDIPDAPAPGEVFDAVLRCSGAGDVCGMSIGLAWNGATVEPVSITAGELLSRQSRGALVLPAGQGALDVALLGSGPGIQGQGELARVTFRVLAAGDPSIAVERIEARDADNRTVSLGSGAPALPLSRVSTSLRSIAPNPTHDRTQVEFALARADRVKVSVFDLSGRRVRTLLDERMAPGIQRVIWNGCGESGARVPAGFYAIRLETTDVVATRRVMVVR